MSARERIRGVVLSALHSGQVDASKDIDLERQRQAVASTARFVSDHMAHLTGHRGPNATEAMLQLLRDSVDQAKVDGLVLEFGVATGFTLREIASRRTPVHGFDSFEGLPEDWRTGYGKGVFAQEVPDVPGAEMHVGWFEDTLPKFLVEHPEPFSFVHMDADLYASTKTVFDLAFDRFVPGTVIVFNEYFNYPGWERHEHRAFIEFAARYAGCFEYVAYNAMHEQVTVHLTD